MTEDAPVEVVREWLWLNHGCTFQALYGDDGEMQCGGCRRDFKRDPLDELLRVATASWRLDKDKVAAALRGAPTP